MNSPLLRPSRRSREYKLYSNEKKSKIIIGWLFTDHKHHRGLDSEVPELDSGISRGNQSVGVLHHLGLKKGFKDIFYWGAVIQINTQLNQTVSIII